MIGQQDYFILWSIYCVAAFILLLASIFFTGFLWRFLKEPVVLVVVVLLFSPALIDPAHHQYAPAIAVMAIDFLWGVGNNEANIANELVYRVEVVLAVYFVFIICVRWPAEKAIKRWRINYKARKAEKSAIKVSDVEEEPFITYDEDGLRANERI